MSTKRGTNSTQFDIRPSVIKVDPADAYLHWTKEVLRLESLNPKVVMEFSVKNDGVLCGIEEAVSLLTNVLPKIDQDSAANVDSISEDVQVWALSEGDEIVAGEPVLRVIARYSSFGLYETSLCGMISSATGWATAAYECVVAARENTVISYAARYVHPNTAHIIDYASVVGGCSSASTLIGSKQIARNPIGNMPHALPLIFGDTVLAVQAFDKHIPIDVQRIALVDTFKDEPEEGLNVAQALRERLRGVRLDTPAERGGVTPTLVREVRQRLDEMNFLHVEIYISGGLTPDKIKNFEETNSPVNGYFVGDYISSAKPNNVTANIREIDNNPVAKRGRIPGRIENPRLDRVI